MKKIIKQSNHKNKLTPEFYKWLDKYTKKYKGLLKELARTPK